MPVGKPAYDYIRSKVKNLHDHAFYKRANSQFFTSIDAGDWCNAISYLSSLISIRLS